MTKLRFELGLGAAGISVATLLGALFFIWISIDNIENRFNRILEDFFANGMKKIPYIIPDKFSSPSPYSLYYTDELKTFNVYPNSFSYQFIVKFFYPSTFVATINNDVYSVIIDEVPANDVCSNIIQYQRNVGWDKIEMSFIKKEGEQKLFFRQFVSKYDDPETIAKYCYGAESLNDRVTLKFSYQLWADQKN